MLQRFEADSVARSKTAQVKADALQVQLAEELKHYFAPDLSATRYSRLSPRIQNAASLGRDGTQERQKGEALTSPTVERTNKQGGPRTARKKVVTDVPSPEKGNALTLSE